MYLNLVVVISDASIRNNVATSITYIYLHSNPVKKTLYHAIGIISSEPELFAIRCSINQAVKIHEVSHIIFITDLIHIANQIFNSTTHSYQQQLIAIFKDLQLFFNKCSSNLVEFWNCSSNINWPLYTLVDKEMKKFNFTPLLLCKISWDFNKKQKYNNIIRN